VVSAYVASSGPRIIFLVARLYGFEDKYGNGKYNLPPKVNWYWGDCEWFR
jgi:hypothetical protein